jgi:HK97 family phage major capsid protein
VAAGRQGQPAARDFCGQHGIRVVEQKFSDDLLQKLHQENVNTSGGFLVPEEFSADIIDLKETYGVARRLFGNEPMTSDTKTFPRRTAGLTAYPVGEGAAGTESTSSWDQVRLTAKDWMVLTRMTNQLNADSVINWADKLAYEIAYAFASRKTSGFNGDATSTYGGITGLGRR